MPHRPINESHEDHEVADTNTLVTSGFKANAKSDPRNTEPEHTVASRVHRHV